MNKRRGRIHAAPWNPKELHLGPADDCHACGTAETVPQVDEDRLIELIDPATGIGRGLVASLVIWAAACFVLAWWWWS